MDSKLEECINEDGIKLFDHLERIDDELRSLNCNLDRIADALEALAECSVYTPKGKIFCISGTIYNE